MTPNSDATVRRVAGNAMLDADYALRVPLRHVTKVAALAAAAQDHHVDLPLTDVALRRWQRGIALVHGTDDVASAITVPASTDQQVART
jgi:hypothetical protein